MATLVNVGDEAIPTPKQIRFINNQGQPPTKRRRINIACLTCRKRKTRCAGEHPTCSTCDKNGHVCLGYSDAVDRKKGVDHNDEADEYFDTDPEPEPRQVSRDIPSMNANGVVNGVANGNVNGKVNGKVNANGNGNRNGSGSGNVKVNGSSRHSENLDGSSSSVVSNRTSNTPQEYVTPTLPLKSESMEWEEEPPQPPPPPQSQQPRDPPSQLPQTTPPLESLTVRPLNQRQSSFSTESDRSPNSRSPILNHIDTAHRVPYFRYFGPTAIVPGFKQMVVKVRDRRRSSMSATSPSAGSVQAGLLSTSLPDLDLGNIEDIPSYDVNDANPVHPLILNLVETFFLRLGSNYPFLRRPKFLALVEEKRVEPILVDAVCALAARFSDLSLFRTWNDGKLAKSEYGQAYAQRAKAATVDTFACPSVAAIQACLLMAYDGFGADQDSALWMYLGIAIRMAVDLGLPREDGVKYHGVLDPWYSASEHERQDQTGTATGSGTGTVTGMGTVTGSGSGTGTGTGTDGSRRNGDTSRSGNNEQKELEQERVDTFWAVFFLDRAISSGTGRPVTLRDDDFDLSLPKSSPNPTSGWPNPYAALLHIIHLYGRVSDVLNNIKQPKDLTKDKLHRLSVMENELTKLHQKMDSRLRFDANNFQAHVKNGNGTTFILLHFWFHALIIVLHQPTLLTSQGAIDRKHQLKGHSRELSMSSAKTIADILAFAELLDPRCFIGNPFTSQPIYIAACAFLLESKANSSQPDSRNASPPLGAKDKASRAGDASNASSKHLLLASAAVQNYQLCYKALTQMYAYWGGVRYILNVLDQKSHGQWDCETFTMEEYESTKRIRRGRLSHRFGKSFDFPVSPMPDAGPPLAWSLTGTTNSPNSSLTLLFQNPVNGGLGPTAQHPPPPPPAPQPQPQPQEQEQQQQQQQRNSAPTTAPTPPGNMIYDPIRHGLPQTHMYPPAYPQPNTSALRESVRAPASRHHPQHRYDDTSRDKLASSKLGMSAVGSPSIPYAQRSTSTYDQPSYLPTTSPSGTTQPFHARPNTSCSNPTTTTDPIPTITTTATAATTTTTTTTTTTNPTNGNITTSPIPIPISYPDTCNATANTHPANGHPPASYNNNNTHHHHHNNNNNNNNTNTNNYSYVGIGGGAAPDLHLLTYDNETDIGQHLASFEHTEMLSWFGDYFPPDVFGFYTGETAM